MGGMRLIGKRS